MGLHIYIDDGKGDEMPAKSKAQLRAMAVAMHNPGKLFARNKGLAEMDKKDLRDFAGTKEKGLPEKLGDWKRRKGK